MAVNVKPSQKQEKEDLRGPSKYPILSGSIMAKEASDADAIEAFG